MFFSLLHGSLVLLLLHSPLVGVDLLQLVVLRKLLHHLPAELRLLQQARLLLHSLERHLAAVVFLFGGENIN